MCLGGSTTAHEGEDAYPVQLEDVLNERDVGIRFKVINKGVNGADSAYILSNIRANLDRYNPDMVIAMIGVNDGISTIPYEDSLKVRLSMFVRGLRVYKLAKVLYINIMNKSIDDYIPIQTLYSQEIEDLKDKRLFYVNQGRFDEAEKAIKQAMLLKPDNPEFYTLLADQYILQGRYAEAEGLLKKAIAIDPKCSHSYAILGWCYNEQDRFSKTEEVLRKAMEIDPAYRELYNELAHCYKMQGKTKELQELIDKTKALDFKNDYFYGFIAACYTQQDMHDTAEGYYKKADEYRMGHYKRATRYNYRRLKEIVTKRGIKFVCVQYPVRSVKPLKKLFDSTEGMTFVDNEKSFKRALRHAEYGDYFLDNFAGDFGHCTRKGNRLLAENVADAILKKWF